MSGPPCTWSNAPALVDVAAPADFRHLDGSAVGAGRDGFHMRADHDLLLVGPAVERLAEDAAVEAGALRDAEKREDRRRRVDVAGGHADRRAPLEVHAPGQEGVANVPRAHAAVVNGMEPGA